ncbi:MAG: hypothetical protein JSR37_07190 [Verrucomicrobia bacterium]|nr:hypothetical protein [Verrucomicrobiota bacterium]MBS0637087.1 hypothetical protein [Verrucomicrobiota bacterium]
MQPVQSTEPGFFGRIGNRMTKAVVAWATSHEPIERSVRIQNSNCGKLITDISNAMSRTILEGSKSTFVQNGQEEIQSAMNDLMNHVFSSFATEGLNEENISDEELTDHFFATIIKKVVDEYEAHPTLDNHTHYKNIAQKLLNTAFPKGPNDEKLPLLLRKLLGGNAIAHWLASRQLGSDQDLTWDGLTALFATHLESIFKAPPVKTDEAVAPLIDAIIEQLDKAGQENDSITVSFPKLSEESNRAINKFFSRVQRGQFARPEDKELFDKARTWFLGFVRSSLHSVYNSLFSCKPDQTPQERRVEFVTNIAAKAKEILPQVKDANILIARASLERILAHELQPEKIAPLLPQFISAETVINQIYTFLAPYLVEGISQFNAIEQKGSQALQALEGNEITKWVDKGLTYANQVLATKAANKTFQPTKFPFINELICQGIAGFEGLDTPFRYLIAIIIKEAVGEKDPKTAIGDILDMILTEGQKAITERTDLKEASRTILGKVLSKELFTSLLPPSLKNLGFYEGLVDTLKNYLQGLSDQNKKLQALNVKLEVPELKNMLATITKKASSYVATLGLKRLVDDALPKIVEAIFAYHLNPKDKKSSQKRAAELLLQCATIAEQGFESGSLEETADKLIEILLPPALLNQLIPKEFAPFKLDKILAQFSYDYIKDAYDYSQAMKQLASDSDSGLLDLQGYLFKQMNEYFNSPASKKKTWIEEVTRKLFTTKDQGQKELLMRFSTNIYLGAIGFLFKTTPDVPGGKLFDLFGPIAEQAQELFLTLNANKELAIAEETIAAYKHATGKDVADKKQLAYWVTARKALDTLYSDEEWAKRIPEFLQSVLTKDMAANFATSIYETVHATQVVLQNEEQKGIDLVAKEEGLTAYIDSKCTANIIELLQDLAKEDKPLNSTLPILLDNFLKECCSNNSSKVADIRNTLIKRVVYTVMGKLLSEKETLVPKINELMKSYQHDDPLKTSKMLIEMAIPQEALDTPLAKLLISKVAEQELADMIRQIKESVSCVLADGKRAKEYLYDLPGMKPFVEELITNLDESLDKRAAVRLTDDLPPFIDDLLKACVLDPKLGPIVKTALHNIVYILLEEALTPKLGQTIEERLAEVLSNPSFKTILPEQKLKSLLPTFLKNAVTHEKLMKWFFDPYAKQVEETKERIAAECSKPVDPRAVAFVKKSLLSFTEPTATKRGLAGYQGAPRELERTIISTQIDHPIVEATVGQITRNLEARGFLDPNFIAQALSASLDAEELPKEGAIADALLKAAFPEGKTGLLVPAVAQDAVWDKARESLTKLVTELSDPNKRLMFAVERIIPFTTDDKVLIGKRQQQIEDMRHGEYNAKIAESCFKRYSREAAMRNVELAVEKENLWWPFKWIKTAILKTVTYFAMRFSLSDRLYNFVIDPKTNDRMKKMLWSFAQGKRSDVDLKKQLERETIMPYGFRGLFASQLSAYLKDKTIVDIVT